MEERLSHFIDEHKNVDNHGTLGTDGTACFVHHLVIELARDCLDTSKAKLISSHYFFELTEKLEKLRQDVSHRGLMVV